MKKGKEKNKGTVSIKAKLLGTITPVVIVLIVILVTVSYLVSAEMIERYSKNLLESSVGNQAAQIEAWLNENLASFQIVKTTVEKTHPGDGELQTMLDSYYDYNSNYPEGIYIADASGKLMKASKSAKEETDPGSSTWYQEGLTRVNMGFGSAYQNTEGTSVISASGILDDGSGTVKVISADMSLERVSIIVNSFIEMSDAQAFLVNGQDSTILAHRDSGLVTKNLGEAGSDSFLKDVEKKLEEQNLEFCTMDGNMTVFEKVAGTDWILVSYIPTSIVLKDLSYLRNIMMVISAAAILILCILIERVTHIVIKPVKKLTGIITAMASGDFTVSVNTKGRDEIAVMSRSVEKFLESMKRMLSSVGTISTRLGQQASQSDEVSHEMYSAASIQSQSMGKLNTTVDQLSSSVNEIARNATQLAMAVSDTKDDSAKVEKKIEKTVEVSQKGRRDMEKVGEALESIRSSIQNLEGAVNKVGTASGEIVQIVGLIGDIAEETNLLSLNASIEAARAGEAGKGFAVVASEIGKLAHNSAESVSHISQLISQVNGLVADAVNQAGESAGDIQESSVLINTAVETFHTIFNDIHDTSALIERVLEKINQVDQVAMNVAAISEEQAASSDEILSTSEDMLSQAEGITKNSEQVAKESRSLSESSEQLAEQVGLFRI